MSGFKTSRVDAVQIEQLVTDPDLQNAEGALLAALATRASQVSIDELGNTLGPAIVNATADKATSAALAAAKTALLNDLATRATSAALQAALDALLGAIAPKATTQALADALESLTGAIAPKATSAEVAAAQAALVSAINASQSALTTALGPKATSQNVTDALTALQTALGPKATAANVTDAQTALAALLEPKATSQDVTDAKNALTTGQNSLQTALLNAISPKATSAEIATLLTNLTALLAPKASSTDVVAAGFPQGATIQCTNVTGVAPAGWTRASGVFLPQSAYEQQRFVMTNGMTYVQCNNSTTHFKLGANNSANLWAPAQGVVTAIASPANYTSYPPVSIATDTMLYAFGGNVTPVTAAYKMQLSQGTWSGIAPMPGARQSCTVGMFGDGTIAVIGGSTTGTQTYAACTSTIYKYDPTQNTWATGSLGYASFGGRTLTLKNGAYAGYILAYFPANQTANAGQTAFVASARAFLISPAMVVTEVDGLGGIAAYELADGTVVSLWSAPGSSRLHDFSKALGSQSSAYAITAPTGIAGSFTPGRDLVDATGMLVVSAMPNTLLFYTGVAGAPGSQTFVITKN